MQTLSNVITDSFNGAIDGCIQLAKLCDDKEEIIAVLEKWLAERKAKDADTSQS